MKTRPFRPRSAHSNARIPHWTDPDPGWVPYYRTVTELTRHVSFEACFNFRDLGGYETRDGRRVRWGALYRSDTLHRLTTTDVETFLSLGLKTVVDLRSRTEIDDHGRVEMVEPGFAWHHVPMSDEIKLAPRAETDETPPLVVLPPGEGYVLMAEQHGAAILRVFTLLAQDRALPAVFHCTSGKDRTGIVAALMLDLLGVPDRAIVADYALTEAANERSMDWIEAHEPNFAAYLAQIPYERRAPHPEKIAGFLDRFRARFGSAEQYLLELGATPALAPALRDRLLTD